uniref:Uncharacterized protein n=1 Tax=Anguilla anguilla TaxID=7936 RepID=A0A0E9Q3L8_ANGAN
MNLNNSSGLPVYLMVTTAPTSQSFTRTALSNCPVPTVHCQGRAL